MRTQSVIESDVHSAQVSIDFLNELNSDGLLCAIGRVLNSDWLLCAIGRWWRMSEGDGTHLDIDDRLCALRCAQRCLCFCSPMTRSRAHPRESLVSEGAARGNTWQIDT